MDRPARPLVDRYALIGLTFVLALIVVALVTGSNVWWVPVLALVVLVAKLLWASRTGR
jgi:hypothetical protein